MTLDEHIKKADEDAVQAESDSDWGFGNYFIDRTEALEYAENCRQLAEWLKDYKRLLEQEPILDKIRAEVTALKSHHINDGYDNGFQRFRIEVLEIFDKYKAESLEQEPVLEIKTVTNAEEAEVYPISENITKGFEEFTKMMFKQGQAERKIEE